MSQEKVDRNKAAKANRKKDMQKDKARHHPCMRCRTVCSYHRLGWLFHLSETGF